MQVYILVTLSLLLKWSYQSCGRDYAVRIDTFTDIKVDEYLLWSEQGLNVLDCVGRCVRDPRCHSFQVEETTGTCRGHSTSFARPSKLYSPTETVRGFQLFLMQLAANYIGDGCVRNGDCHVTNSMCNGDICTCSLGYMFSPSETSCYSDCPEWSDDLTRHEGSVIYGFDDFTFSGITEAECRRRCVEANNSSFTCKSADYRHDQDLCHLSSEHFGSIPEDQKGSGYPWVHYKRNCGA